MEISVLGIDLAKNVFQLHGVDASGKAVLKRKLSRSQLLPFLTQLRPCLIGMESCSGSHYWARKIMALGHEVRIIAAQFVKPFVKTNKNDQADAEAICEAIQRPNMRFVSVKGQEHQDIQALHRVRSRLVRARTALSNEIRGFLLEYGIAFPKTILQLHKKIPELIQNQHTFELSSMSIELLIVLKEELDSIEQRIDALDEKIKALHKAHPVCQRLAAIPGVGPITSTAILASVVEPQKFKNGRQFSAWLGLVPKQYSSGGKSTLLGISKRGDRYLRTLLIHGARAVLSLSKKETSHRQWAVRIKERRGANKAAVALANKNARIIWVILTREVEYQSLLAA